MRLRRPRIRLAGLPIAVFNGDGEKFATVNVAGSKAVKATWPRSYRLQADIDELDPTWGLPLYALAVVGGSVDVEVTDA